MIKNKILIFASFIICGFISSISIYFLDYYLEIKYGHSFYNLGIFGVLHIGTALVAMIMTAGFSLITFFHIRYYKIFPIIATLQNSITFFLVLGIPYYFDYQYDQNLNLKFAGIDSFNLGIYQEFLISSHGILISDSQVVSVIYSIILMLIGSFIGSRILLIRNKCLNCNAYSKNIKGNRLFFSTDESNLAINFFEILHRFSNNFYEFKNMFNEFKSKREIDNGDICISYHLNVCPSCNEHYIHINTEKKNENSWDKIDELSTIQKTEYDYLSNIEVKNSIK